jgi:hypothetical protein
MNQVYLVLDDHNNEAVVAVYSSFEKAKEAVKKLLALSGNKNIYRYYIDQYDIDVDPQ